MPHLCQFIQLGFASWEEQREAMGPSGLSTIRPQRVENDGFTRGSPQTVIFPLNIANFGWLPPHRFKTTQQFESSELLNKHVTEHLRFFWGMRAPLHKQSNSPRMNLRRLYAFFSNGPKRWTLVKLCLKQTTKPVCWILKKLWHREYSGWRLFGIWLKIHRFWRGLVFKWSVRVGITTYTTLKFIGHWLGASPNCQATELIYHHILHISTWVWFCGESLVWWFPKSQLSQPCQIRETLANWMALVNTCRASSPPFEVLPPE